MKAHIANPKTHSQIRFSRVQKRADLERQPMDCRVSYTYQAGGSKYSTEGYTCNFSKIGCGIRGTIIPPVGSQTRLRLHLMDQKFPISLDATVTWVAGNFFGVRFPEVTKKDYMRIQEYMWNELNKSAV